MCMLSKAFENFAVHGWIANVESYVKVLLCIVIG